MDLFLVFVMHSRLFIAALWSPAGKGLTSWLLFVMFYCFFSLSHVVSSRGGGGGGGGGTLIFSAYVGSDPASTVHPKKISGISSTPKKYLKF